MTKWTEQLHLCPSGRLTGMKPCGVKESRGDSRWIGLLAGSWIRVQFTGISRSRMSWHQDCLYSSHSLASSSSFSLVWQTKHKTSPTSNRKNTLGRNLAVLKQADGISLKWRFGASWIFISDHAFRLHPLEYPLQPGYLMLGPLKHKTEDNLYSEEHNKLHECTPVLTLPLLILILRHP